MKTYTSILISIFLICFSTQESFCQSNYILAGDTNSNSVIYYDFDPDIILYNDSITIDIDNDNKSDYVFLQYNWGNTQYIRIRCLNGNSIYTDSLPEFGFYGPWCDTLNLNDTVNSNLKWSNYNSFYSNNEFNLIAHIESMGGITHNFGFWYNLSSRYLGFMLDKEPNNIFGWMQLSIDNSNKLILQKYAYSSTKTDVRNINSFYHTINIFPNPCHDEFNITRHSSQNLKCQLRIYDLFGQLKHNQIIEYENDIEINIKNLDTGVYIIQITYDFNHISWTKRLLKI